MDHVEQATAAPGELRNVPEHIHLLDTDLDLERPWVLPVEPWAQCKATRDVCVKGQWVRERCTLDRGHDGEHCG